MELVMANPPKRRRRAVQQGNVNVVALGGMGYLAWCLVNKVKTGTFSWTPWKSVARYPALTAGRTVTRPSVARNSTGTDQRYAEFLSTDTFNTLRAPTQEELNGKRRPESEEPINFIMP